MSDNFELQKSSLPQTVDEFTPYTEKQFNYCNDINQGVYTNTTGQTLVTFDLSAIYNSSKLTNTAEFYAVIPIIMYFEYLNGTTPVAPGNLGYAQMSLKSGQPLINQCEVQWSGNNVKQSQPLQHLLDGIMLASSMDQTNLKELGRQYNFASSLDSYQSAKYVATATDGLSSPGISNNYVFPLNAANYATDIPLNSQVQNLTATNRALQEKISWYIDTSQLTTNNSTQFLNGNGAAYFNNEFTPIFQVSGNLGVYFDYVIIPLAKIIDAYDKIGLTRRCDSTLRLWLQTGYLSATITPAGGAVTAQRLNFSQTYSTFTIGCPFTLNNIAAPGTATQIVAGIGIGTIQQFSANVNGGSVVIPAIANPMNACRLYYPLISLEPSKQLQYLESHKNKRIFYKNFYTTVNNNIAVGANFSALIQSGVRRILSVIMIPLVSSTVSGFSQYQSPFDTCGGCSFSPISLTNLNVQLGGQNVLQNVMSYSWEEFWEQVNGMNKLAPSNEFGLNAGLISSMWWTYNRIYYIDCSRCSSDDFESTRAVNISFRNNSNSALDLITYVVYLDSAVIDCYRGVLVSKD